MRIRPLASLGILLIAGVSAAAAQTVSPADDVVTNISGIDMVCAGATSDSRERWAGQPFSARIEFVGKNGQYLGLEEVSVEGSGLNLQIACNGPWVLMNLPNGAYHVSADIPGTPKKEFDLKVGRGSKVTILRYTDMGGEVCVPQGADDCKSDQSGVTAGLNTKALVPDASDPEFVRLNMTVRQIAGALAAQQQQYDGTVAAYNVALDADRDAVAQLAAGKTQCANELQGMFTNLQNEQAEQKRWNAKQRKHYQDDSDAYAARQQACEQETAMLDANQRQTSAEVARLSATLSSAGQQIAVLNRQLAQANTALSDYRNDVTRRVTR